MKNTYSACDLKYYDILSPEGKHCHGQYLTEKMVENMRARGFRLRLQRDYGAKFE